MLVELQPAAGPVTFSKDSAWRNMMFSPASEFIHDADISLFGLPAEPTPRDVYIYVQAHNMPAKIGGGDQPPPPDTVPPNDNQKLAARAAQFILA